MADLASLGLAVDLSQVDAASKSLGNFSDAGKSAQISADVLVASAVRLGISVEEVQRRLDAANDNMENSANQAMKLADATKMASAANDNYSKSINSASRENASAGKGFFEIAENVLSLTGHLKLLAVGAYALSPAFRGIVNAGISKFFTDIIPTSAIAAKAMETFSAALTTLFSILRVVGPPILAAVAVFEIFNAVWIKGAALIDKYANSLRALYSDDVVQNLQKLTKNQGEAGEVINAAQIARATELGVRLQDASFIIDRFLKTSIIDLTGVSLKLQAVWVNVVETIAKGASLIQSIPWDKITNVNPVFGPAKNVGKIVGAASDFIFGSEQERSLQSAKDRLSAIMGVANLAAEGLGRAKNAAGDLDKELDIGSSFIARYSDNIQKLANGGSQMADTWDRTVKSIERHTRAMEANAASSGMSLKFQESLRVETQLLNSTKNGANAATDDQIDKYVELRTKGTDPLNAALEAGIKLNKQYAETLKEISENAGNARQDLGKTNFELAHDKTIKANAIAQDALSAFSPAQKGAIAARQKELELEKALKDGIADKGKVEEQVAAARELATATELRQIAEVTRARELSAKQAVDSAKVEVELIGKTIGQQTEIRANLQARQALEQEASQRRTAFDTEQYERLKKINEELGKQAQINAVNAVNENIKFNKNTSLLSPDDVAIAQQLKGIYPDVAEGLNSVQASAIRTNSAISGLSSTMSSSMVSGFTDILDGTKSVSDGFKSMSKSILRSIEEMIVKLLIVGPLMRSLQTGLGSFLPGGGEGPITLGGANGPTPFPSANGNVFYGGNVIPFARGGIVDHPTIFPMANGAGLMGEAGPEAIMPLTRGQDGKLGVAGGGSKIENVINITAPPGTEVKSQTSTRNSSGGMNVDVVLDTKNGSAMTTPGTKSHGALKRSFGIQPSLIGRG